MAEYIDRVKLLDELGKSASHHAESGREYQLLLRDRNIVREQPTADVIERSKIDNALADMQSMLDQEVLNDNVISDVGQGIEIAMGLLQENIGE